MRGPVRPPVVVAVAALTYHALLQELDGLERQEFGVVRIYPIHHTPGRPTSFENPALHPLSHVSMPRFHFEGYCIAGLMAKAMGFNTL